MKKLNVFFSTILDPSIFVADSYSDVDCSDICFTPLTRRPYIRLVENNFFYSHNELKQIKSTLLEAL